MMDRQDRTIMDNKRTFSGTTTLTWTWFFAMWVPCVASYPGAGVLQPSQLLLGALMRIFVTASYQHAKGVGGAQSRDPLPYSEFESNESNRIQVKEMLLRTIKYVEKWGAASCKMPMQIGTPPERERKTSTCRVYMYM